jgi:hypothetical protein
MEFRATTAANAIDPSKGVNEVVSIPPGGIQNFVLGVRPSQTTVFPQDIPLIFRCSNVQKVATTYGTNTVMLAASVSPTPDMIALAATVTNDGVVNIPGPTGTGVFAASVINVGAAGTITARVDDNLRGLAVSMQICRTNPSTGACLAPPGTSVTSTFAANEAGTYTVFATGTGNVPFDPARNRLFLRLTESSVLRGATSVAVRTAP